MIFQRTEEEAIAIVPVRAGSKGLPGKNLMPLNGVPLYLRAVRQGILTVGNVVLSTDIREIDEADLPAGCALCRRPEYLGADDTTMAEVIEHVINDYDLKEKTIVLLQATSPLRMDHDIRSAIALFAKGEHDIVLSVTERDRAILKYGVLENNTFTNLSAGEFCFYNRQQLPPIYGPNGAVYVFSANRFLEAGGFPADRIGAIDMPENRSMDIDTLDDFVRVEQVLHEQRLATEGE